MGVAVTGVSHLQNELKKIAERFQSGVVKKTEFEAFIEEGEKLCKLLVLNLERASNLIRGFKQVAVNQSSETIADFVVAAEIHNIVVSMSSEMKNRQVKCEVDCPEDLCVNNYPGAFSQILSNLIMNSFLHGFEDGKPGIISIKVQDEDGHIKLIYEDNGKGIPKSNLKKVFEPFFTTRRSHGSTGLGMHIVYNLVVHKMQGQIGLQSDVNQGVKFSLLIPKQLREIPVAK